MRKRNFGATFADAVDKANAERLSDLNDLRGGETEAKERSRSVVRTRGGDEWSVERLLQRASVIKPRFKSPPPDTNVGSAITAALNATTEQQQQPRGRIRLKGSFLGIYAKGNTTPRSPRTDDDLPQRPDKRERNRNLRIRRPFISSDSGKTTTTTKSTTSTAVSKSPRAPSTAFTTTAPSSHEHSSLSSGSLTSSEKIINLKGIVKEYKEIVRTSSTSTTTLSTTSASATAESSSSEATSDETRSSTATTKRVTTTATTATQDDIATAATATTTTETLPSVESVSESGVISSESSSVSDRASTSLESASIQSAAAPSSAASLAVTESKELPGSGDMKQSKTHNNKSALSQSIASSKDDITTRNPIEIQRPREELQKDLLDAIRRKISRNKQQLASVAQISVNQAETEAQGGRVAQQSNFISSSTKNPPLFFRPGLSFPGSKKNSSKADPRIKIFVNLPPGSSKYQDPTSVKIPNISHIRSKIERLNDAINTGLKLERIREKEAAENDRRHSGIQKTVVRSQSSSVQIVSQKSHQDSVHNDQGNQETLRKQSLVPSGSKSEIKNQFESRTTTAVPTTTTEAKTTTTTTTAASTTLSDDGEEGVEEKEKPLHEHPSSHFRPANWTRDNTVSGANWTRARDFIPMPKSNLPPKEDVQLFVVTPKHVASYKPVTETPKHHDDEDQDTVIENVVVGDQEPVKAEKEAEDITNTTIIVIAVISVIPVAGLVAWGVRTVLRRKVGSVIYIYLFIKWHSAFKYSILPSRH